MQKIDIIHKIWNIPTLIQITLNDIPCTNEFSLVYNLSSNYVVVALLMNNREVNILHNNYLNVMWKDKHLEIMNDKCVIEVCSDTIYIINGIINEYNIKVDKLTTYIIEYNSDLDTDDETEYQVGKDIKDTKCDYRQLEEIEAMVNSAIRPKFNSNRSFTKSIYKVNKNMTDSIPDYDNLESIIYTPKINNDNSYVIARDINVDIKLYSGLDIKNTRNDSSIMTCYLDRINLIHYSAYDNTNNKILMMVRNISMYMISNRTTEVL